MKNNQLPNYVQEKGDERALESFANFGSEHFSSSGGGGGVNVNSKGRNSILVSPSEGMLLPSWNGEEKDDSHSPSKEEREKITEIREDKSDKITQKKDEESPIKIFHIPNKRITFKETPEDEGLERNSIVNKEEENRRRSRKTRLFPNAGAGGGTVGDIFSVQELEVKKGEGRIKKGIRRIMEHTYFEIGINCLVIYALYADDFRTIFAPKDSDVIFDVMTVICMIGFISDILGSVMVKVGYLNSFFFYLDILSTLTLFFDITYVYEELFYKSAFANRAQLARASRASRIGTRAGRLIKFFDFDRFLYCFQKRQEFSTSSRSSSYNPNQQPSANAKKKSGKFSTRFSVFHFPLGNIQVEPEEVTKESRVGKKLSELTTKRVILIVLLLLLFVPVFSSEYQFAGLNPGGRLDLEIISRFTNKTKLSNMNMEEVINSTIATLVATQKEKSSEILLILIPKLNITYTYADLAAYRKDEVDILEIENLEAHFSIKESNTQESILNIFRTTFICSLLLLAAMIFSKDANNLALHPIERMINKVNRIANNPLMALEEKTIRKNDGKQNFETLVIENAIVKIGSLLALGYGEAGSGIIASNVSKGNSGAINPLLPGKKLFAVFGFCDIRNFTDVTEVLQEEVMIFVNTISSLVHKTVDGFLGNTNKNIGDAFLLVWKLPDSEVESRFDGLAVKRSKLVRSLCDLSMLSFLKILIRLTFKQKILKYSSNPNLNDRLPNFRVKMGFGLHMGWAIEGAIGSEYKIDASYLSPNVNIAARLEAATKQYGVHLLISDKIYEFCSKKCKNILRAIDIVTVKGSINPLGLFTADFKENKENKERRAHQDQNQSGHKIKKSFLTEMVENDQFKPGRYIDADRLLKTIIMQNDKETQFKNSFKLGFDNYIGGKWDLSKKWLDESLILKPNDGPTMTLRKFMEKFEFVAPKDWKGYRELTEK